MAILDIQIVCVSQISLFSYTNVCVSQIIRKNGICEIHILVCLTKTAKKEFVKHDLKNTNKKLILVEGKAKFYKRRNL